ncbi:MAG: hypothetical protein NC342_03460 [Pseudoflavonifractor sp.]|nr:hypothetical protein [Pseudoflavonifractor sp.]
MTSRTYHCICDYLRQLIQGSEWEGHIFAVGGCCRDEVAGLPIKDVDLAIDLPDGGIRFARWLHKRRLTVGKPVTYPMYGTAMLHLRRFPDEEIELVQTRKEKYSGRRRANPAIVFGSLKDDCLRRDLTVNALYYDISRQRLLNISGRSLDDIKAHRLRTPADPDTTFDDDPVRILRCIRFAATLGWDIDPETYKALCRNAPALVGVSPRRAGAEIEKMLTSSQPINALEMMRQSGTLAHVIPELMPLMTLPAGEEGSPSMWEQTLRVVAAVEPSPELRLAALFHDLAISSGSDHEGKSCKMARHILRRLKFERRIVADVMTIIVRHGDFELDGPNAAKLKEKKLRRLQYTFGTPERLDRFLSLIDAINRAGPDRSLDSQAEAIRERSRLMVSQGTAMYGYSLPVKEREVTRLVKLPQGLKPTQCISHLMNMAYVNPRRSRKEFINLLREYVKSR